MQQTREYGWLSSEGLDRRDLKVAKALPEARDMSEVRKWLVALASANLQICSLPTGIGKRIDLKSTDSLRRWFWYFLVLEFSVLVRKRSRATSHLPMPDRSADPQLREYKRALGLRPHRAWEWESFQRFAVRPRYRQRGLAPWRPKLIEATAVDAPQASSCSTFPGSVGQRKWFRL